MKLGTPLIKQPYATYWHIWHIVGYQNSKTSICIPISKHDSMASIQNCLLNSLVHLLYCADALNAFAMSSQILSIIPDTSKKLRCFWTSVEAPFFSCHGIISVEHLLILAMIYGLERSIYLRVVFCPLCSKMLKSNCG